MIVLLACVVLVGLSPLALRAWVRWQYGDRIYARVADAPSQPAAIVFGAGYWPSGRLSDALADRMDTAIELYQAGKVNKLLLTGDNRFANYNEPARMAEYAQARGVSTEDLVLDYAGRRTYDSCYRARAIFGVERAVLVTQAFHLPRALFTCDRLGLDVMGVVADRHQYVYGDWYRFRELLALARAWLDVALLRPLPVLGDPIPVDWGQRMGRTARQTVAGCARGTSTGPPAKWQTGHPSCTGKPCTGCLVQPQGVPLCALAQVLFPPRHRPIRLGEQQRPHLAPDRIAVHHALDHVRAGGDLVHHIQQRFFEDGPQAPRPGLAAHRRVGCRLQGIVCKDQLHAI